MTPENTREHAEQIIQDEAKGEQPQKEPSEFVCKVCGHNQFGCVDDYGYEYSYCQKCFTNYDDDWNIIPEGPEPDNENNNYDPDDPDKERDIEEDR